VRGDRQERARPVLERAEAPQSGGMNGECAPRTRRHGAARVLRQLVAGLTSGIEVSRATMHRA